MNFLLKTSLVLGLLVHIQLAYGYKIIVFTDQEDKSDARRQLRSFHNAPFNEFSITYSIVYVPNSRLGCRVTNKPVEGAAQCNHDYIRELTQRYNADQALVVTTQGTRAVGGSIPVIPASRPGGTMVHEYLHTLGFKDEYVYAHGVADLYCHAHHSGANVVAIMPRSSYATDSTARSIHARQIPWMSYIVPSTLITSGSQLGTPDRFHEVTGLFKSDKCKNASKPISLWKPGHGPNIMTDVDEEIGPALEPIVRRLLIAQGAQIKRITRRITTRWLGLIKECLTIERTPDGKSVSRITPHARCLEGASPEAISDGDRDTTPTTPPPEPSPSSAPHVHQE